VKRKGIFEMPDSRRLILLILALTMFPIISSAQVSNNEQRPDQDAGDTSGRAEISCFVETGIEYSENVFHLDGSQKRDLKKSDADDEAGGRFDNMESVSDTIITPRLGLKTKGPGLFAGGFEMAAWLQYNAYSENTECSYPEAKLSLAQDVGDKNRVTMEWKYMDGFFKKNYLSEVDDRNENGNIPKEERVYSSAVYDAYEGTLSWRYTPWEDKDGQISRIDVEPFGGWYHRSYNAIFRNRDRRVVSAGIGTRLGFLSKFDLDITWQYDHVSSPGRDELVLFDETLQGMDVNDDGEIKGNAALTTAVDRSCDRYTVSISPSLELTNDCSFYVTYKWRRSVYSTDNKLDLDHYDQTPVREQLKAGLRYDFSKSWSSAIEFARTVDDAEEDDDGYAENKYLLAIKYKLN